MAATTGPSAHVEVEVEKEHPKRAQIYASNVTSLSTRLAQESKSVQSDVPSYLHLSPFAIPTQSVST